MFGALHSTSSSLAAPQPQPQVIIVTGPTAVGKSATGLLLAKQLNGEIISADSVQVYTGLDVGSDKVPISTRREVPHHLIDVLPPNSDFTVGDFFDRARAVTEDILQRGKVPIVVGGTGFYLRWYMFGKPETPPSTPEAVAAVEELVAQACLRAEQAKGSPLEEDERWDAAVKLLAEAGDEDAAVRIGAERNNYYRLTRALLILRQRPGRKLADLVPDAVKACPYDCRCFFLVKPRLALWDGITLRCEQMVTGGLLQEAADLLAQGVGPGSCPGAKAIGYSQALDFLLACRKAGSVTPAAVRQLVMDIAANTRQLVKKQLTWFRDDEVFQWVDATPGPEAVAQHILQQLQEPVHQGGCGDSGRLSKGDERLLKTFIAKLQLLAADDGEAMQGVLAWVRQDIARHAAAQGEEAVHADLLDLAAGAAT